MSRLNGCERVQVVPDSASASLSFLSRVLSKVDEGVAAANDALPLVK